MQFWCIWHYTKIQNNIYQKAMTQILFPTNSKAKMVEQRSFNPVGYVNIFPQSAHFPIDIARIE